MFDTRAFEKASFTTRTATVKVPALAAFFKDGEPAEFTVRGLTGNEMMQCTDAAKKRANVELVVDALQLTSEHKKDFEKLLGNVSDLSAEIVRRLEMLTINFPDIKLPIWIKVCDAFPVVFFDLTQNILELTGQGKAVEKPLPSGETETSDQ